MWFPPPFFNLPHMHIARPPRMRLWLGTDKCNPSLYEVYTGGCMAPAFDSRSDRTWRNRHIAGVQAAGIPTFVVQHRPGPGKRYGTPGFFVAACLFLEFRRAAGLRPLSWVVSVFEIYIRDIF